MISQGINSELSQVCGLVMVATFLAIDFKGPQQLITNFFFFYALGPPLHKFDHFLLQQEWMLLCHVWSYIYVIEL